jgi:hypothetical protein
MSSSAPLPPISSQLVIDNPNVFPYPATLLRTYHLSRFWPIVILRHSSFTIAKLAMQYKGVLNIHLIGGMSAVEQR